MKYVVKLLLASFLFASAAAAEPAVEPNTQAWNVHQGWYLEANAGSNLYYLGIISSVDNDISSGFTGFGWSGAVGYHFSPSAFALEAGFMQNYAELKISADDSDATLNAREHLNVPYLALRWDVALGKHFAIVPKVGLLYLDMPSFTATGTDFDGNPVSGTFDGLAIALPFVGLGASYAITPHLSIIAQYQGLVYLVAGAGLFSAGLDYNF